MHSQKKSVKSEANKLLKEFSYLRKIFDPQNSAY